MKRQVLLIIALVLLSAGAFAQQRDKGVYQPVFAVKTNALYWATTTPNLGFEVALSPKITLDISGNYNPWTFSDNEKLKHWLVQPELRYWLCDRFSGHFLGIHAHYTEFNVGGIKMLGLDKYRYQGNLYGGGISYGYHWILSKRWSIEGVIGVGYAHIEYDKYKCRKCGSKINSGHTNYVGPTKVGINLIYVIK